MGWEYKRAQGRIEQHIARAPVIDENVASLTEHRNLVRREVRAALARGEFPRSRAVVVTGVHMYGQLLDFEDFIVNNESAETEESHKRMLSFLDTHYRIWDSLVQDEGGFTVDFHGPRLHAVIVDPSLGPKEQIERAIALAWRLTKAAEEVGQVSGFRTRARFGLDYGTCLALTTGRSHETDTLFLGSPANHAAKTVAAENVEGIFLSPRAQRYVQTMPAVGRLGNAQVLNEVISRANQNYRFDNVDAAVAQIIRGNYTPPEFTFRRHTPPLATMKFGDLIPSQSVRLGSASLFADIDGYTSFVDEAISSGLAAIKAATTGIHVIREELNDVLKDDFGGKRVRFIGDCIQGLLAEGKTQDDPAQAVENSIYCASGMRDSFDLIRERLRKMDTLDLAVGIEFGPVAVTRIGNRGDASIRCAAGRAVIQSERVQQSISGGGVRLGQTALVHAPRNAEETILRASRIPGYDDVHNLLGSAMAPAIKIIRDDPEARPYCGEAS